MLKNGETHHDRRVTPAQFEAAAEATRVGAGRAHFVPHDEAAAYQNYLRQHGLEMERLLRIRREYMGDVPLW